MRPYYIKQKRLDELWSVKTTVFCLSWSNDLRRSIQICGLHVFSSSLSVLCSSLPATIPFVSKSIVEIKSLSLCLQSRVSRCLRSVINPISAAYFIHLMPRWFVNHSNSADILVTHFISPWNASKSFVLTTSVDSLFLDRTTLLQKIFVWKFNVEHVCNSFALLFFQSALGRACCQVCNILTWLHLLSVFQFIFLTLNLSGMETANGWPHAHRILIKKW